MSAMEFPFDRIVSLSYLLLCVLYNNFLNGYIFYYLHQDYSRRDAYILTQAPLNDTVNDFWRMISQYDIGTVVMLNSLKEEKEVYFTYVKCEIPNANFNFLIFLKEALESCAGNSLPTIPQVQSETCLRYCNLLLKVH